MALFIALGIGAWHDAALLARYPVAVGIDGYYYVLQIDELKNLRHFYFPTKTPLTLYFLTGISYFTNDSVAAVKIGSVLLHTLLCLGIFALVTSATSSVWLGVLGSALAAVSGLHLYMIAEFINVLGAFTFMVWSGWCIIRFAQSRRPRWIVSAVTLLMAAIFSHKLSIAIGLFIAGSLLLFHRLIRSRGRLSLALLAAILAVYFGPALIKAQAGIDIPQRVRLELTAIPQWPINWNYLPEGLMLLAFAPPALILLAGPLRKRAHNIGGYVVGLVALWSLLVTLNPFLNGATGWVGIVGRIRGLAYIQVALLAPGVIWLTLSARQKAVFYVLALLPPFAILSALMPVPFGLRAEYLARREHLVQQLRYHRDQVSDNSLVIAAHGDQFLVSATIGVASQRLAPESTAHAPVYWLLDMPKGQASVPESIVVAEQESLKTILVKDAVLRSYLQRATDTDKRLLLDYNRHLVMAYYRGGPGNPFG